MIKQIVKFAVLAIVVVVIGLVSYVRAADCCAYNTLCPVNWQCERMEGVPFTNRFVVTKRYYVILCKAGDEFETCVEDAEETCATAENYLDWPCNLDNYSGNFTVTIDVADFDEDSICCY